MKKIKLKHLFKKNKKCYIIHENSAGEFLICKVLNICNDKRTAFKHIANLSTGVINEKYLLKIFNKREEL